MFPHYRRHGVTEAPVRADKGYLRKVTPEDILAAIEKGLPAATRPIVKVRLRNTGICTGSGRQVFLCRFFQRMMHSEPDYLACLDLVLSLLETAGKGAEVYDLLVEHKRSLFRSLQQARRFETRLGRSNMETLMLQGVRAPHVSPDALMHHMRLIDLICLRIFVRCAGHIRVDR